LSLRLVPALRFVLTLRLILARVVLSLDLFLALHLLLALLLVLAYALPVRSVGSRDGARPSAIGLLCRSLASALPVSPTPALIGRHR
jgi:hypothetical protein